LLGAHADLVDSGDEMVKTSISGDFGVGRPCAPQDQAKETKPRRIAVLGYLRNPAIHAPLVAVVRVGAG
jgi:hypothetical protein